MTGLRIAFFGSSLVSTWWNGAATYYRGILRHLDALGDRTTFYEPDAFERQRHRDIDDPPWAGVVVYPAIGEAGVERALEAARGADVVVKASGVGVHDALLEREVARLGDGRTTTVFWDVDAPATLERLAADPDDPLREHIPSYDLVLTYGGGPRVVAGYTGFGARRCVPVHNGLDPSTHHPAPPDPRFAGHLGFLGNRLPDREARVRDLFFGAASLRPARRFLLGGNGWDRDVPDLANVTRLGHVGSADHNAFNRSSLAVLNVNRDSMARYGWSPPTRMFEAAGAAACMICDRWEGVEAFFEPERELLVAADGAAVAALLDGLDPARARSLGEAARRRALAHHTYRARAALVDSELRGAAKEATR